MSNTAPLPKEIHERFTKEGNESGKDFIQGCRNLGFDPVAAAVFQREQGYFVGAQSEYLRAQPLVEALDKIANNTATPYSEEQAYSWIETARFLANDALIEYNQQL